MALCSVDTAFIAVKIFIPILGNLDLMIGVPIWADYRTEAINQGFCLVQTNVITAHKIIKVITIMGVGNAE